MSKVFVLDTMERPLNPVHPGWARKLLSSGQAAAFRRYPFTIILKREVKQPVLAPLRLKIDPGSKTTGLAVVNDVSGEVIFAAELTHRGQAIKKSLDDRRAIRRSRRQRQTRYRQARFANRRRKQGWLPPSLGSRIANILTWVRRLAAKSYRYWEVWGGMMMMVKQLAGRTLKHSTTRDKLIHHHGKCILIGGRSYMDRGCQRGIIKLFRSHIERRTN